MDAGCASGTNLTFAHSRAESDARRFHFRGRARLRFVRKPAASPAGATTRADACWPSYYFRKMIE